MDKNTNKIVAVTPAGRAKHLEVLSPYILRDKEILYQWIIWINTHKKQDIEYCHYLKSLDPNFIKLVEHDQPITRPQPQPPFYRMAIDSETTYVKLDDDLCWIAPDAISKLVQFRINNPEYFIVMANTICNGYCAAVHQRNGSMTFKINNEIIRMDRHYDNKLYRSSKIAEYVHKTFINDILNNDLDKHKFEEHPLDGYPNFSINCICWNGNDFAKFGGKIEGEDEERWLCTVKPPELGKKNCIAGNSLVSHFAYYTMRKPRNPEIDHRILDAYKLLAQQWAGEEHCKKVWGKISLKPVNKESIDKILNLKYIL